MTHFPRLELDALIFARNDALIDVSQSCPPAVVETVETYLTDALGLTPAADPLLTPLEAATLYAAGGFADYQDVAATLIIYFIEMLPPVPSPTFPAKFHIPAILAYLQLASGRLQINLNDLRAKKNVDRLTRDIIAAGGGLNGANAALPRMNRHLLVEGGPVTGINLVGRIYQELYLGAELFSRIYDQPAIITRHAGYIQQENLRIDPALLSALSKHLPLGLTATCSRAELDYTLQRHQLETCFQISISRDETDQAQAAPAPAPWSLLETARHLKPLPTRSACIGAAVADIQAARAAAQSVPYTAIGVLPTTSNKETVRQALEKAGANAIIGHPNHLQELILD